MAERRMMSKKVIHGDQFMDLPSSTKVLYFYLMAEADDDGFVNSPKRIQRMVGATDDDASLLIAKKFILTFESGVIVVKHWKIHNYIRSDRYTETSYKEEKSKLNLKESGAYTLDTIGIPSGSIGKDRLGKESINKPFTFTLTRLTSVDNLSKEYKQHLKAYIEETKKSLTYEDFINGLEASGKKYKNFKSAYTTWAKNHDKWNKPQKKVKRLG